MINKLKQYALLMRVHKPIGILLLLWPTMWAVWLAGEGRPNFTVIVVYVVGVILMRSAGCIINDFADRYVDGYVKRTSQRPLVTKDVSPVEAIILFVVLSLCAFSLTFLFNRLTILLAIVGAVITVIYPYMKRFTHLPQLGLGLAFTWGVPMAFAAEMNRVPYAAWFLFFTAAMWPVIYDTMYAMTDRDDDVKVGIKSTAILFGKADRIIIGILQVLFLICLAWVGFLFHLRLGYYGSLFIAAVFFVYQQWLIKDRDPQRCFTAFLNNHWVGLVIFLGIAWSYLE